MPLRAGLAAVVRNLLSAPAKEAVFEVFEAKFVLFGFLSRRRSGPLFASGIWGGGTALG